MLTVIATYAAQREHQVLNPQRPLDHARNVWPLADAVFSIAENILSRLFIVQTINHKTIYCQLFLATSNSTYSLTLPHRWGNTYISLRTSPRLRWLALNLRWRLVFEVMVRTASVPWSCGRHPASESANHGSTSYWLMSILSYHSGWQSRRAHAC